MARILITGSADGLGQLSAKSLADQGHQVVLHARNAERGRYAKQKVPRAEHVISGDLSDIDEAKNVAYEAHALGRFDAVIHNAGVDQAPPKEIFIVNTIEIITIYYISHTTMDGSADESCAAHNRFLSAYHACVLSRAEVCL